MTPRRLVSIPCALLGILLLAVPMLAVEKGNTKDIVRVTVDSSAITVEPETELDNGRIRLLSPEGLEIVRDFKGGFGQVTVEDLAREVEELSLDGCWTYEIVGTPSLTKTEQSLLAKARETGRPAPGDLQLKLESMYQSGSFNIERGRMVFDPNTGETDNDGKLRADVPNSFDNGVGIGGAPTDLITGAEVPTGLDHQVISGDLTVYNSICVGFDCPTNPTFGADTIRLQENNLRIHFDDTSTAAGFPSRDWRIIANDQASGGLSRFSVQDVTGSRIPFTIEAAAPSNSLYADSSGRVGFGTSNPVLELHAVDGDTPALRLEQDGSSGFQPQVWDLAGNETSFFVRDATNGSTLPFRIFPGESSNSLVLRNDGVGVGTLSPSAPLHVRRTNGSAKIVVEEASSTEAARELAQFQNNGTVTYRFTDTQGTASGTDDFNWIAGLRTNNQFIITLLGTIGSPLWQMDSSGNVTATSFNPTSSRELKEGFESIDAREVLARVSKLPIAEWQYRNDVTGARHIGPTAEDFKAAFGLGHSDKSINLTDTAGVAFAAIQGLQLELMEKKKQISTLQERLEQLEAQFQELSPER